MPSGIFFIRSRLLWSVPHELARSRPFLPTWPSFARSLLQSHSNWHLSRQQPLTGASNLLDQDTSLEKLVMTDFITRMPTKPFPVESTTSEQQDSFILIFTPNTNKKMYVVKEYEPELIYSSAITTTPTNGQAPECLIINEYIHHAQMDHFHSKCSSQWG